LRSQESMFQHHTLKVKLAQRSDSMNRVDRVCSRTDLNLQSRYLLDIKYIH